jgi:penicillin amidase
VAALFVAISAIAIDTAVAKESVTIKRDAYGVPHVFAEQRRALFYGFGYAMAEDRLFQAEITRRTANGTVAAVLGSAYVDLDKRTRADYEPESLRKQYERLPQLEKDIFLGYSEGFSARVDEVLSNPALMPAEFTYFGFKPSHMSVDDLLAIFVHDFMIRFSGYNAELDNLRLLNDLAGRHSDQEAVAIFRQLRWVSDSKAPATMAASERTPGAPPTFESERRLRDVVRVLRGGKGSDAAELKPVSASALAALVDARRYEFGVGSEFNAPHASLGWVSGKSKTDGALGVYVDGAQMGFTTPSVVWGVGLHGPGFNMEGITLVGVPLVLFGTNGRIAWGGTAGMGDVVDMYQENLNPKNAHEYLFNGKYLPMERRIEQISVKGGASTTVEVFSTVHGVVKVFDLQNNTAYTEKRAWQGFELESLLGWMSATQQTTFEGFHRETARWGISSNWLYGDYRGNVSYIYTGRFPSRPDGQDFRLPAVGTGSMEWNGFRPYAGNPSVAKPKEDFLASWNNIPQPGYHSSDATYWGEIDHVVEIQSQLRAKKTVTPQDMWNVTQGVAFINGNVRVMKPLLIDKLRSLPPDSREAKARDLIVAWDGIKRDSNKDGLYDDVGQTIFREWLAVAEVGLLQTDLSKESMAILSAGEPGGAYREDTDGESARAATQVLAHSLEGSAAGVGQTYDLLHGKSAEKFVIETFSQAVDALTKKLGTDMTRWQTPVMKHTFQTTNYLGVPITTPDRKVELPERMSRASFSFWITFKPQGTVMCDVVAPSQSAFTAAGKPFPPSLTDQLDVYESFGCKPRPLSEAEAARDQRSSKTLTY